MRCRMLVAVVAWAAAAQAQDPLREAAAKVYAAVRDDAGLTLDKLASQEHPDPWWIAEELCFHGAYDAATAFAAAVQDDKLATYVASRKGREPDPEARRALAAAHRLRIGNFAREARATLEGVGPPGDPVLQVRLHAERARILRDLGERKQSDRSFLRAGKLAHRIGWRRGASRALRYLACRACFDQSGDGKAGAARNQLVPGEATIAYGAVRGEMFATVITAAHVWYVPLGPVEDVETVLREYRVPTPGAAVVTVALADRLVGQLGLGDDVRRLLIVGSGFEDLPWVLLAGDREVAFGVDVWGITALHPWEGAAGRGVLALGVARGEGDRHAEQEAHAVGDVVLSGVFTPAALDAALATRPHWRAVHVALPERQTGRLCLEPIWENEGQRNEPRIDLLVWSTAVSPRGPWGQRTWDYHGPPRVIRTLWEPDPAATCALMKRFHELWSGETALPACTALKRAQDFVRTQAAWRHPYYWAGWQLWASRDPAKRE